MFESIINFFKKIGKQEKNPVKSKDAAKERLHLVLMQDRANVSADFLDLMKQEIIEVIKKYIDVDENAIDVRLTNKANADGTTGAPALYANIPIVSIKEEVKTGMARQKDNLKEQNNEKKVQIEQETQNKEESIQKKEEKNNETEEGSNKEENKKENVIEESQTEEKLEEEKTEEVEKEESKQEETEKPKEENKNLKKE